MEALHNISKISEGHTIIPVWQMAPIHLYYFPTSFYSQKVLIALHEKELKYKETIILLMKYEEYLPWFMRLNRNGQVPLLKVEDKYIPESETIIEVVDKLSNVGPVLVPDPKSPEGQVVDSWRKKLNGLDIERLTYGVMLNPELSESGFYHPLYNITKEGYMTNMNKTLDRLEDWKEKYPDLRDAYDAKIKLRRHMMTQFEKADIVTLKEVLEGVFDAIEAQLMASRNDYVAEHWLCGPTFTAADITLCVLLGRLRIIGLLDRYLDKQKRPAMVEYWNKAQQRPSVQRVAVECIERTVEAVKKRLMTKVATGALVACGVVALGLFIGHKYRS